MKSLKGFIKWLLPGLFSEKKTHSKPEWWTRYYPKRINENYKFWHLHKCGKRVPGNVLFNPCPACGERCKSSGWTQVIGREYRVMEDPYSEWETGFELKEALPDENPPA